MMAATLTYPYMCSWRNPLIIRSISLSFQKLVLRIVDKIEMILQKDAKQHLLNIVSWF